MTYLESCHSDYQFSKRDLSLSHKTNGVKKHEFLYDGYFYFKEKQGQITFQSQGNDLREPNQSVHKNAEVCIKNT